MLPSYNLDIKSKKNAEIESGRTSAKGCIEVPVVFGVYELRCVCFTTEYSTEPGPLERPFLLCCCLVLWLSEFPAFSSNQLPASSTLMIRRLVSEQIIRYFLIYQLRRVQLLLLELNQQPAVY